MKLRIRVWYPDYYEVGTRWSIGRKSYYVTFSQKIIGLVLFIMRAEDKLSNDELKELIRINNELIQLWHKKH